MSVSCGCGKQVELKLSTLRSNEDGCVRMGIGLIGRPHRRWVHSFEFIGKEGTMLLELTYLLLWLTI